MPNLIPDGSVDFSLGQNSWNAPDRIQENQYARGVNLSNRGGTLKSRPGFHEQDLTFEGEPFVNQFGRQISLEQIFIQGKFQAMIPWFVSPDYYLIIVISGLIFRVNVTTRNVILLSRDIRVNQYYQRVNWSYAGEYLVIFDFPDYPVIISSTDVFRSDPDNMVGGALEPQVPISTIGTYNQNRLFVANAGNQYTAGDPVGNLVTPEAPITFTESLVPGAPFFNQILTLPTEEAVTPITAMGFIQQLDASTGIGPMFISTADKVYFAQTNQPRAEWEQGQFAGLLLSNTGIAGPRAVTNVNSDLIFISQNADIHALSSARNEAQTWGNVPISREVGNYLKQGDRRLYQYAVMGYFDNRVYATAYPYRTQALDRNMVAIPEVAFAGMVVLEIDNLASLLSEGTPTWSGVWTGVRPLGFATLRDRAFIMSKDGGRNALYEVQRDEGTLGRYDIVRGNKRKIKSIIYTKEYSFQDAFALKREHTLNLHLEELRGCTKVSIDRKPSHSAYFLRYRDWKFNAKTCNQGLPDGAGWNGYAAQTFRHIIFGDPVENGCNPITKNAYDTFTQIQYRFTIEADYWVFKEFRILARQMEFKEDQEEFACPDTPGQFLPRQCEPDWQIPQETLEDGCTS